MCCIFAGCGVKRLHVVLSGLRMRLLSMYVFHVGMIAFTMFMSLCVDVMVMSSA